MINIIDEKIYSGIIGLLSIPATILMTIVSHLGSATVLILLSISFLIILKNKKLALIISLNLVIVYLLNLLIKLIVGRPRPEVLKLVYETSYSFPSGHAMVSTGFYGLLMYISYKKIKNKVLRNTLIGFLGILIFLIGISRIYLGAHYATDVIGGIIIGIIYLIIYIKIIKGVDLWTKSLQ